MVQCKNASQLNIKNRFVVALKENFDWKFSQNKIINTYSNAIEVTIKDMGKTIWY